jgi:flavorubredoxin
MVQLTPSIYRHSTFNEAISLSFNQYLIDGPSTLLVHTGDVRTHQSLLAALQDVLGSRDLDYIFVSHFESDECGALAQILEVYPNAQVLTGAITARQLAGFGILAQTIILEGDQEFTADGLSFHTITYPSEMHLWDGLLLYDKERRILYSSDLMMRFGALESQTVSSSWIREIEGISEQQVPNEEKRTVLQKTLTYLQPKLVLPGHGPALDLL